MKKKEGMKYFLGIFLILIGGSILFILGGNFSGYSTSCINPLNGTVNISLLKTTTTQGHSTEITREQIDDKTGDPPPGWAVSSGDLNKDAYNDLVVGLVRDDSHNLSNAGATWVLYGPLNKNITLSSNIIPVVSGIFSKVKPLFKVKNTIVLTGEEEETWSGNSIAVGDVSGDGCNDIFIGAYGYASNDGKVYVIDAPSKRGKCKEFKDINLSDANDSLAFSTTAFFGSSVKLADLNEDGYSDMIVGARNYLDTTCGSICRPGRVFIYLGPTLPTSRTHYSVAFKATTSNEWLGFSIATDGDFNGDGCTDLILGGKYADYDGTTTGRVYLLYQQKNASSQCSGFLNGTSSVLWDLADTGTSKLPGIMFYGEKDIAAAGEDIAFAGDVNADGYDDILIGSYAYDGDEEKSGAVYLVHGGNFSSSNATPLSSVATKWGAKFLGQSYAQKLGFHLSPAGDVDADGYDDFLIGMQSDTYAKAYLVYGSSSWSGEYELQPLLAGSEIVLFIGKSKGGDVEAAGDVDNDGYDDLIITDSYDNGSGTIQQLDLISGGCR